MKRIVSIARAKWHAWLQRREERYQRQVAKDDYKVFVPIDLLSEGRTTASRTGMTGPASWVPEVLHFAASDGKDGQLPEEFESDHQRATN